MAGRLDGITWAREREIKIGHVPGNSRSNGRSVGRGKSINQFVNYYKMGFLESIKDAVCLGYEINFSCFALNLIVSVKKRDSKCEAKQSWLPLSDHFYEEKIIAAVNYMIDEIQK